MSFKPMKTATILLLIASIFLTLGCAGRTGGEKGAPTATPAAFLAASPTLSPAPASAASGNFTMIIDPSLADILGEDEESMPELGLPTPAPE